MKQDEIRMIVAFSRVFVACSSEPGHSLGLSVMILLQFNVIFQIVESPLHFSERLFQSVLVSVRRFGTRLLCIYATALQISISKFQFFDFLQNLDAF